MKNKILALVIVIIMSNGVFAQCAYWGGVNAYSFTSSSIAVSWGPGRSDNEPSVFVSFQVSYQKFGSDVWTSATSVNVTNLTYEINGLAADTDYNVKVSRYCDGVYSDDSVFYSIKTAGYNEPLPEQLPVTYDCTYWYGFDSYSTTDTSITLKWYQGGNPSVFVSYQVWYKNVNSSTWILATPVNIYTCEFTIPNLVKNTDYNITIKRYCNGVYTDECEPLSRSIRTNSILGTYVGSWDIMGPNNVRASNITYTSANIVGSTYPTNSSVIDAGFVTTYYRMAGESDWSYNPTSFWLGDPIENLTPNVVYESFLLQTFERNPHTTYSSYFTIQSPIIFFKTPPLPGACGSVAGSYYAPAIHNNGTTDYYDGTITSKFPVTQSTVTHTFSGSAICLNPGFETTISNTGGFVANAFNPDNCISSAKFKTTTNYNKNISKDIAINIEAVNKVTLYPNPTSGMLNIDCSNPNEKIKQITLTDALGQVIFTHNGIENGIDISHLASGLYVYKIETNQGSYTGKIIKK